MIGEETATPRPWEQLAYDEPFGWWGPLWTPPVEYSIGDLVEAGVLSPEVAALLWALLARRASLIVAAGPSQAGKTTLLTALLDFLPAATQHIYLRGCYEPFRFLQDPAIVSSQSYLLINEISAHLPIYLWGPAVHRALACRALGFSIAATAHATSPEQLVGELTGYPLRLPTADLAAIDLLVILDAWRTQDGIRRQVNRVVNLVANPDRPETIAITPLAWRDSRLAPLQVDESAVESLAARLRADKPLTQDELRERATVIRQLARQPNEINRNRLSDIRPAG